MHDKYIIFSPYTAGYCNVLLSYEIAFAIAHITDRKIIIPPTNWCVLIDHRTAAKETWQDIWSVLDITAAKHYIDIVNLLDYGYKEEYWSSNFPLSWTGNMSYMLDDVYDLSQHHTILMQENSFPCFYNSARKCTDLNLFAAGRELIDLNINSKYINIQGCLFGHYWHQVYAGLAADRNAMKQAVNNSLKYKSKFHDMAATLMPGQYNAIHVRNPKQINFDNYAGVKDIKDNPELLLELVSQLLTNDKPLYVSTDIDPISCEHLFSKLSTQYQLKFSWEFQSNLTPLESIAVDQLICAGAELFYGTYYSTFSKRINVMRGLNNKQANDNGGFNKHIEKESPNAMPWIDYEKYEWHMSSLAQWTYEE
jgi:hypothetical protein